MSKTISNIPYDQIPHIVINHPETKPEHWAIMIVIYKLLKEKPDCIYSNEALVKACRTSERTLRRRLDELESWGFIIRNGESYARRFKLGLLFNTAATMAGSKLNTPAKSVETPAKIDCDPGHSGRYTKNSIKNSSKEFFPSDFLKTQDKAHDLKMKEYQETIRKRKEERK